MEHFLKQKFQIRRILCHLQISRFYILIFCQILLNTQEMFSLRKCSSLHVHTGKRHTRKMCVRKHACLCFLCFMLMFSEIKKFNNHWTEQSDITNASKR